MEKQLTFILLNEAGDQIGTGSGTYEDEALQGTQQTIQLKTIAVSVTDTLGNVLGNGLITYDDYITYGNGGSRTVDISGSVYGDSTVVGSINGTLTDDYGAITTAPPPPTTPTKKSEFPWWLILLFALALAEEERRKKK